VPGGGQVVPVVRAGAVRAVLVTTSMWQRGGCKDAPVNNLMVRSQSACSFQGPGISDPR